MLWKSALVTTASGKVGGLVMSHNAAGQYGRAYRIPVNPATSFQVAQRDYLSTLMARFRSVLTDAQRAAWAVFGTNVATTNRVGDVIYLSGQNWYVACNALRLQASVAVIDAAPTTFALINLTLPVPTTENSATTSSVAYTNADAWATGVGGYLLCYASRPQNNTVNFFAGPYRFAGKVAGAATPPTSPATITLPFPAGPAGGKIFWRFVAIGADGRPSSTLRVANVVVPD